MANPFRSCDYCKQHTAIPAEDPRQRAWRFYPVTHKLACPRCFGQAANEDRQAARIIQRRRELLKYRLLAEPQHPYGSHSTPLPGRGAGGEAPSPTTHWLRFRGEAEEVPVYLERGRYYDIYGTWDIRPDDPSIKQARRANRQQQPAH